MTFDEYYNETKTIVKDTLAELNYSAAEIKELDEKSKDTKKYTQQYIQDKFITQKREIDRKMDRCARKALGEIERLAIEQLEILKKADELNPADITEDAKLLNVGVILSTEELESIFDRNKGNSTMEKLIMKYATQNNVPLRRVHTVTKAQEIRIADCAVQDARMCFRFYDKPRMYQGHFFDNIYDHY